MESTSSNNSTGTSGMPTTSATNKGYVGRSSPSTYNPGQPNNPSFTGRNSNPNYGGAPTFNPTTSSGSGSGTSSGSGRTTTVTVDIPTVPTMTVDEVYGKTNKTTASSFDTALDEAFNVTSSNMPSSEKQGDYAASSNEKSVVKTDTFGKQDEISVTPELVTENKGQVGNDTIQSVEGLDFQQKDKESQAVLDSKKSRDEVEAEEKADDMRDKLRNLNKETDTTSETTNTTQIGESDAEKSYKEQDASYVQKLNEQKERVDSYERDFEYRKGEIEHATKAVESNKARGEQVQKDKDFVTKAIDSIENGTDNGSPLSYNDDPTFNDLLTRYKVEKGETTVETLEAINAKIDKEAVDVQRSINYWDGIRQSEQKAYEYDLKLYELDKRDYEESVQSYNLWKQTADEKVKNGEVPDVWEPTSSTDEWNKLRAEQATEYTKDDVEISKINTDNEFNRLIDVLKSSDVNSEEYQNAKNELGQLIAEKRHPFSGNKNASQVSDELYLEWKYSEKPEDVIATAEKIRDYVKSDYDRREGYWIDNIKKDLLGSNESEETKTEVVETLDKLKESQDNLIKVTSEMSTDLTSLTPEQIETFVKANDEYLGRVKEANSKGIKIANTDLNTEYTKEMAKANDFDVTLSDGSTMSYSDFSAMMATQSPQIAAAMYNAKAKKYEEEGKNFLADIERMKAKMAMDTLGSKFTFADDKVRNQFIQMAETNERATFNAYNNILNNPNASPSDKAEADMQMRQAEMLSTMAATLKASTGFFSGMGDSVKDGFYGTTDPDFLNKYQKVLNVMGNAAKIVLGAGVTPGAADAWNNLYYTAGYEVKNSKLFNTVFNFDPDGDGFNLFQEYGNSATAGLVAGVLELGTGVAMLFNTATAAFGANIIKDSISTFTNGLYGVQKDSRKSEKYTQEVLDYFKEARDIASKVGDEEVLKELDTAIPKIEGGDVVEEVTPAESEDTVTVTENFELGQDEVNDFNNWVEGSGSNTAENDKFNQSLTYDEWLKLIEADPTMREYAKNLLKDKPAEEKAEEDKTDAEKADAE